MRCEACRELLWAYLEQELNAEETAKIEQHLGECAECREELEAQKAIMESLQSLPDEELPEGYHEELMQKLRVEAASNVVPFPVKKKQQPKWKQLSLIAAAALVVVAAGGMDGILGMRESQNEIVRQMTDTAANTAAPANESMPMEDVIVADEIDDVTAEMQWEDSYTTISSKKVADTSATVGAGTGVATTQKNKEAGVTEMATDDADAKTAVPEMTSVEEESAAVPFSVVRSVAVEATDKVVLLTEDMEMAMIEIQKAIAEADGYEEESAVEDTILAVIPVENFENFSKELDNSGELEWIQKGNLAEGAAYRSVEIQVKIK